MKRLLYITLFTFLGILSSFLVHAGIEIPALSLLVKDFDTYSFGLSWETLYAIHSVGGTLLFLAGAYLGYKQGKYWWQYIYVDKRLRRRR